MDFDDYLRIIAMVEKTEEILEKKFQSISGKEEGNNVVISPSSDSNCKETQERTEKDLEDDLLSRLNGADSIEKIADVARNGYSHIDVSNILDEDELKEGEARLQSYIDEFNSRYELDNWDYVIAGGCGLMAALFDLICGGRDITPGKDLRKKLDSSFSRIIQDGFRKFVPPEVRRELRDAAGSDLSSCSVAEGQGELSRRFWDLSSDPVLGFFFGVHDALGKKALLSVAVAEDGTAGGAVRPATANVFHHVGRIFGRLLSGLSSEGGSEPAVPLPFLDLLKMFQSVPLASPHFKAEIEDMYSRGYDFRQFMAKGIPGAILEILMRCFFVAKQVHNCGRSFSESLLETMPLNMNPRFRIMLAMGYGAVTAADAGKLVVNPDIFKANYVAWVGFLWNGFHAMKWALADRDLKLSEHMAEKEYQMLERCIQEIDMLTEQASLEGH